MTKHKHGHTHEAKKKLDIASICKNTLLVCSAITALGGAVGGLKEQFMGESDRGGKSVSAAPVAPLAPTIIIEQRAVGDGRHMSKTVRIETGGEVRAADARVGDVPVTESSLTGWKLPWGWMLCIGTVIVGGIIGVEILYKRMRGKSDANTDSR